MRIRFVPVLVVVAVLVLMFWLLKSGRHEAETLSTPFPATVLSALSVRGTCNSSDGCRFSLRVRITNPTDGDANVQGCTLQPPAGSLWVNGIPAGLPIAAHATVTGTAGGFVKMPESAASTLVGLGLSCTGLDWHGDAPI